MIVQSTAQDRREGQPPEGLLERARRANASAMELTPAEERALAYENAFNEQQRERQTEDTRVRNTAVAEHEANLAEARAALRRTSWQVDEARNAEVAARQAVREFEAEHALRLDQAQRGLERSLRLAEAKWRERVVNLRRDLVVAEKSGTAVSLTDVAALWVFARFDEFAAELREQLAETPEGHAPLSTITDDDYSAGLAPLKDVHKAAKDSLAEAQRGKDIAATRVANLELNLDLTGGTVR